MQWKRKAQKQKGLNQAQQQQTQNLKNQFQNQKLVNQQQSKFVRHAPANSINNRYRNQAQEIKINLHSKTELFNDQHIQSLINDPQAKTLSTTVPAVIDLASHLKILGDSLNAIGTKLNSNELLTESDALDLLLDSAICAMSPLICLTNLTPELNGCLSSQKQLLDNVAYLMPGI